MRFTLTLSLDNDDAVTAGADALAGYLRDVASRVQSGYGNGNVRDVNGNTIGHYAIDDTPEQPGQTCDECGETIPDGERSMVNAHHAESCSLYPSNVAGR